ncbi:MAG: uracil-DNA glycosylase [Polyangiaceae bacterium]|nr:uracil-DNA glycosylase [Polyangiaceae bacterium]
MSRSPEADPRDELRVLAAALTAHAEWQKVTGASGLPAATAELARARRGGEGPAPAEVAPRGTDRGEAPRAASEPAAAAAPARAVAPPTEPVVEPAERAPREPPEGGARQLDVLRAEVTQCLGCGLHATRTQTVFARGTGSAGLFFVGEGPGVEEDAQGLPFVGAAGQLLDKMIEAMGFDRDEVYVANIVKCRPPNNRKPAPDEMATCLHFLERQLALVGPEVIVALGATAVQGLLGTTEGITRLRGKWKLYKGRIAVMPTFHPAYLLRTPSAKREVWADLQAVLRQMGRALPQAKK